MIYRKQGSVARWENGTVIRVTESGAAREEGELFECWPEEWASRRVVESSSVRETAHALHGLPIERLIVIEGYAEHQYGDRHWSDHTDRLHLSLTHNQLRVLVDSTTRRLDDIHRIATALHHAQPECPAPRHLRLAPGVAAALLPHLPNAIQTAGGKDGYGNDILETSINYYRPSYRMRPVRMQFNVRLEPFGEVDETLPRAIALLAPAGGRTLRVLIEDGQHVYPATVEATTITAVSAERSWFPYGAGSFGAELML